MGRHRGEEGVSEVVATILLIGVTVLLVAIVAAIFLSGPQPDEIPHASIVARNESGKFALAHEGGDPLRVGEYRIYVDTGNGLVNKTGEFNRPDGDVWRVGGNITYNGTLEGGRAVVTVVSGGVETILTEVRLGGGRVFDPDPVETEADFTANVTEGDAPLTVRFTDESPGNVIAWHWDFGDGNTSAEQNPIHTYENPGNYTVSLSTSSTHGSSTCTKPDYIRVTEESFVDIIIEENVFVYGTAFVFGGNNVNGPGATAVITGDLTTADVGQHAPIAVSYIYIDGNVNLDSGSASLGSPDEPGEIHINGSLTLWNGKRHVYGDVYVNGDFYLKDARIHGDVYVNGDLTLNWTPWIAENASIYYTGALKTPESYSEDYATNVVAKCIHRETVPGVTILDLEIPPVKPASWYMDRGYVSSGDLTSNIKIFADSYSSTSWRATATDVIIIARDGDITITGMGDSSVTGIFFAPNGRVTFGGKSLEGVVIARDGFYVTSGGTIVTFKNIEEYILNPEDYPF